MATLLNICQDAAVRIGISLPSAIVGSSDAESRELLAFARQEGIELMRAVPWQVLAKEQTFVTVAADEQTGAIPADFDRFISDTIFNRTRQRKVYGPISSEQWQARKAYTIVSAIDYWFRVRGDSMLLTPTPSAGDTIAFEYISKQYCKDSGGTPLDEWTSDTDVAILPPELMSLGIEWRYKKAKGLEWSTPWQEYTDQIAKRTAIQDGGAPRLSMAPSLEGSWYDPNVKEGNWP